MHRNRNDDRYYKRLTEHVFFEAILILMAHLYYQVYQWNWIHIPKLKVTISAQSLLRFLRYNFPTKIHASKTIPTYNSERPLWPHCPFGNASKESGVIVKLS